MQGVYSLQAEHIAFLGRLNHHVARTFCFLERSVYENIPARFNDILRGCLTGFRTMSIYALTVVIKSFRRLDQSVVIAAVLLAFIYLASSANSSGKVQ